MGNRKMGKEKVEKVKSGNNETFVIHTKEQHRTNNGRKKRGRGRRIEKNGRKKRGEKFKEKK